MVSKELLFQGLGARYESAEQLTVNVPQALHEKEEFSKTIVEDAGLSFICGTNTTQFPKAHLEAVDDSDGSVGGARRR